MGTALRKTEANDGRANSAVEPACGHCGYCVRGIEGPVCPECGSDLREVGIVTPGNRRSVSPWTYVALWTLALPLPAILVSTVLLRTVIPFSQTTRAQRTVFLQAPYLNATLQISGMRRDWQPPLANPNPGPPDALQVRELSKGISLEINLKTGAYSYHQKDGKVIDRSSGFNGSVLADWIGTGGIDTSDQRVRALCDLAYPALAEMAQGSAVSNRFVPFNDATGGQIGIAHPAFIFTNRDDPHPAVAALLVLLWLTVWIYGIRRIARRHGGRGTGSR
jgi:hypothetical protein